MIKRRLDTMGLKLCPLAIGCEPLGKMDWGNVNIDECKRAIKIAFENGINIFDTADVYGLGKSEEELSKALGSKRQNAFIISKFGVRWNKSNDGSNRAKTFKDSSPKYFIDAIENSLRRLRLEAIPLYLVHWPDEKTPIEDTLIALEKARKDGKILNYGLSNFSLKSIKGVIDEFPIAAIQTSYNMVNNKSEILDLLHLTFNKGLSTFTYGPLAQGLLSGKYNDQSKFSINDRRHRLEHFSKVSLKEKKKILVGLNKVAKKHNKTMAQVALRWVLDSNNVTSAIVGIKNRKQLRSNLEVLKWSMDISDWQFLDQIYKSK